jgi:aspartyl-tRNA(Asn)/glutamyl-tRNA(Gln) amidotransferase subunit A
MSITSAQERLEQALARIADPAGEGKRACLTIYGAAARAAAEASDARRKAGVSLGPLDGTIVTIKDLFDVAGEVTRAGSKVLADEGAPAREDAPIVRRLRAAGAVIVAKTNMTEFAFSGLGLNPHFGNAGNPADRARVPGGSSSGGAVAAADGMCEIAIGSDTGGSTRIPAALCGIVGFKPSRQRVPTTGAFPLSFTLDSIGPMARSVADCANADAVMAGEEAEPLAPFAPSSIRLGVAQGLPLADLDAAVSARFSAVLSTLGKAGIRLTDEKLPILEEVRQANAKGGMIAPEAHALHRERLSRRGNDVDPNIRARIERAGSLAVADYIDMVQARARLIPMMDAIMADLDCLIMPTVPVIAPLVADVATPESFVAGNMRVLRNTAMVNFLDLCAISLPMPRDGGLPTGLMLVARNGADRRLFRIAAVVERLMTR